jgi:hypothetical protein
MNIGPAMVCYLEEREGEIWHITPDDQLVSIPLLKTKKSKADLKRIISKMVWDANYHYQKRRMTDVNTNSDVMSGLEAMNKLLPESKHVKRQSKGYMLSYDCSGRTLSYFVSDERLPATPKHMLRVLCDLCKKVWFTREIQVELIKEWRDHTGVDPYVD